MTQDEIIEMAESLGVREYGPLTRNWSFELSLLEAFAKLVAAKEREACAKVCEDAAEDGSHMDGYDTAYNCATAIRARGETTSRGEA